jgi:hypothetical protein
MIIYKTWWKVLAVVLVLYTLIAGILIPVPAKYILNETIRNLYFHVPMWMAMLSVFVISVFYSIKYLNSGKQKTIWPLLNRKYRHYVLCIGFTNRYALGQIYLGRILERRP